MNDITTSATTEAVSRPVKCPDCGSTAIRFYRREWGVRGTPSFAWEEGWRCKNCKRIRIPETEEAK